jgi:SAM-dependent methyltransferase
MPYDHTQSVKEVLRHVLFRCGLSETLDVMRQWRGHYTKHTRERDMTRVFSQIYANGAWVMRDNQDSLSGVGSTQVATQELSVQLSGFLRLVGCRRLVDIGCGDFNWMHSVDGDFEYVGIDVVPQVIEQNTLRYANEKRRFQCGDATSGPIEAGDVAICREVLFHLSFRDGLKLLRNVRAAGFEHVLFTTDSSVWFNSDIRSGDFRRINLLKPPYGLPVPLRQLADDKVSQGRALGVWAGSSLPM